MKTDRLSQKQRLIDVLSGKMTDRAPVICPGGMMNSAVTEVLAGIDENHNTDLLAMVRAAKNVNEIAGIENYGVPFCMTAECEPLGIRVDHGDRHVEPRVVEYLEMEIGQVADRFCVKPAEEDRMKTVIDAIGMLKNDEVPVIGNITGHISTASSIIDPNIVFKSMIKDKENCMRFFEFVNSYLIDYAKEMVMAGADVIAISDPTATGEILGKRLFEKYALPFYMSFVEEIHGLGAKIIFHMCGNAKSVIASIDQAGFDALSFDSMVNMKLAKSKISTRLMGNISTQTLDSGSQDQVKKLVKTALKSGVDIVSPACGLAMSTPLINIEAMTDLVKEGGVDGEQDIL